MEILFIIILITYLSIIICLIWGVSSLETHNIDKTNSKVAFSILIPFRNEEKHLFRLLDSISKIEYSKELFEVILINDASSDNSLNEISRFTDANSKFDLIVIDNQRQSKSPKKDAINTAIAVAKHDWIITTDADCTVPKTWLLAFNSFIAKETPVFIAAAVVYRKQKGFLHEFQQMDWNSLTAMTMGSFGNHSPMLCSGANLCYSKQKFLEIEGFKGNDHIASGDDVFLVNKMQKHFKSQTVFMNATEAIVTTSGVSTWRELINQRVRWASKTGNVPNRKFQVIGLGVFAMNLAIVILVVLSIFNSKTLLFLINAFFIKLLVDSVLLYKTTKNLNDNMNFSFWFWSSLFYPFFSIWVVFASLFTKYEWKGREFSK